VESSKLILEKIKSIAGDKPVVFMGDLNGNRESEWYMHMATSGILKDSHGLAKLVYQPNGSFSSFIPSGNSPNCASSWVMFVIVIDCGELSKGSTQWSMLQHSSKSQLLSITRLNSSKPTCLALKMWCRPA
jgi:hypothetical protein